MPQHYNQPEPDITEDDEVINFHHTHEKELFPTGTISSNHMSAEYLVNKQAKQVQNCVTFYRQYKAHLERGKKSERFLAKLDTEIAADERLHAKYSTATFDQNGCVVYEKEQIAKKQKPCVIL